MRSFNLLLAGMLGASPLAAQEMGVTHAIEQTQVAISNELNDQTSTARLAASGVGGGAAGWVVGFITLGIPLARTNPLGRDHELDDGLWTPGFVIGFEIGEALAIPAAVHVANGRRGDLRRSLLASSVLGAAGTLFLWTGNFDSVFESPGRRAVLVGVPVAQLISSIYFERRGSKNSSTGPRQR